MKCNLALGQAINKLEQKIELNYKLNSTIDDMAAKNPKQKFSAQQLEGYLLKNGISPKEIEASKLFKDLPEGQKAITIKEWSESNPSSQVFKKKVTESLEGRTYEKVSLGGRGKDNPTYKATEFMTTKPEDSTHLSHRFGGDLDDKLLPDYEKEALRYETESQLGWNRVHQDEINGKPTTVLNELQSDWMQAERQGAGTFKSKLKKDESSYGLGVEDEETAMAVMDYMDNIEFDSPKWIALRDTVYANEGNPLVDKEEVLKILGQEIFNTLDKNPQLKAKISTAIADFPMKPEKFQQLMIIDALNEAIENGTKRVAIPIQRENELAGSAGVTKFYEDLQRKVLPDIRKKLEKQGMRVKLSKEDYVAFKSEASNVNTLHVLEILEIPNKKVKWDVYGLAGALGLSEVINEGEEN